MYKLTAEDIQRITRRSILFIFVGALMIILPFIAAEVYSLSLTGNSLESVLLSATILIGIVFLLCAIITFLYGLYLTRKSMVAN